MKIENELRHLLIGSNSNEELEGIGIVRFNVHCQGNADVVLQNCKQVLEVVLRQSLLEWLADEDWQKVLPDWFVNKCPKQETEEATEQWLEWWRSLSPEEQSRVEKEAEWSLIDWLAWFHPDERQWFWWNAIVENKNLLRVAIQVKEWPFPWGELAWLLRASGATSVRPEE